MQGTRRLDFWFDIGLRLAAAGALGFFVLRAVWAYQQNPSRITLLLAIISEFVTIVIVLTVRRPSHRDWQLLAVATTIYAVCVYPLLLTVEPGSRLFGEWTGAGLQMAGIVWTLVAKLALGRSFGLLPADRGIVRHGPYRVVRHPIYLGYLVTHIGFLGTNFGVQNLLVFAALYAAQLYRIHREERTLSMNDQYRRYREDVPYRLIYGVY